VLAVDWERGMRKNAVTMVGDIDKCWLFAYRVPELELAVNLPKELQLVMRGGFGFLNIVVSRLSHMRPAGLPWFVGVSYWHVAYRLHVRFCPNSKQPIEGLYFLRSDADSGIMVGLGNLLTSFRFHRCSVDVDSLEDHLDINVQSDEAPLIARIDYLSSPCLAEGSPFKDLTEAGEFLKYKPAGISVHGGVVEVLRITRDETAWRSRLVKVDRAEIAFIKPFNATLEVCYEVEPIHYRWNMAERYWTALTLPPSPITNQMGERE